MVRCLDCRNLIKSWIPTTKPEWLFDEMWKCKVRDVFIEMYYLVERERYCNDYRKFTITPRHMSMKLEESEEACV